MDLHRRGAAVLAMATPAGAQVLGGRAGGSVGGVLSGNGGVDARVPDVGPTVDRAPDAVTRTTADATRPADRSVRRDVMRVDAGTSTRVGRRTRCYYDDDYDARDYHYDPVYRDGYYYCQRSAGTDAGVGASARVGGKR